MLLREYLEQGWSKAALAAQLRVSRRTIHHWIETGQLERDLDDQSVRYGPRAPVQRKLDAYRGIIETRLQQYPALSAVRLFEEVRAAGYTGSYTPVREYVREVRPRPPVEPLVRFETPAGYQAQVDFAHFNVAGARRWALVFVLSYSRLLWVRFFRRQDMASLTGGLEQAFRSIGGVPQEVLFDQMRAVVTTDKRFDGGPLVENAEFLRFANHWKFRTRVCRPYRAKTKGKVERPIRYLRESFFYAREFVSDDDLDAQLTRWLDEVANVRTHRTTGERPIERFNRDERDQLTALPLAPYRSVVGRADRSEPAPVLARVPQVEVQRRALQTYDELVERRA